MPTPRALLKKWQGMPRQRQAAFLNLGALVFLFLGFQNVLRPQWAQLDKLKREWKNLTVQRQTLREELPNLEREHERMEALTGRLELFQKELDSVESHLPAASEMGRLLGEMVQNGSDLGITFDSVKQYARKDPQLPQVAVEINMSSSYEGLVNYVRRLEQLTPFLKLVQLDVVVPKEPSGDWLGVRLVFVTPLRLAEMPEAMVLVSPAADKIFLPRSPFIAQEKPVDETWKKEIKVSGITFRDQASTAIINGEVMRVGDQIDGWRVHQILRNQVVLSDGEQSFEIPLGGSTGK